MDNCTLEQHAKEKINHFYYEELDFCGCGSPHLILELVKALLSSINERWEETHEGVNHNPNYYEDMMKRNKWILGFESKTYRMTDIQYGTYYLVLNLLDSKGLLEHGGSIGGAWLTDYGKEILSYLNLFDDLEDILD